MLCARRCRGEFPLAVTFMSIWIGSETTTAGDRSERNHLGQLLDMGKDCVSRFFTGESNLMGLQLACVFIIVHRATSTTRAGSDGSLSNCMLDQTCM